MRLLDMNRSKKIVNQSIRIDSKVEIATNVEITAARQAFNNWAKIVI